jgi:hypothetical protein
MKRILFFCFVLYCGCSNSDVNDKETNELIQTMSIQKKLAILDSKGDIPDTSIKIIRIGVLLKYLSKDFNEPIDTIAELTCKAQGAIHDEGIEISNLDILEEMHEVGDPKGIKYRDAVILYAFLKSKKLN